MIIEKVYLDFKAGGNFLNLQQTLFEVGPKYLLTAGCVVNLLGILKKT